MNHNTWLRRGLADAPDSPFSQLHLDDDLRNSQGPIHHRNYANLFRPAFQHPVSTPDWSAMFADPSLPLLVDLGTGAGRFPLLLARSAAGAGCNCLGIDVQDALVLRANKWAVATGVAHTVRFLAAHAAVDIDLLLGSYPGAVDLVCIQFPDPVDPSGHNAVRHLVQPRLVKALARVLPVGARVLLQSEDLATAQHMRDEFFLHGATTFTPSPEHGPTTLDAWHQRMPPTAAVPPTAQGASTAPDSTPPEVRPLTAAAAAAPSLERRPSPPAVEETSSSSRYHSRIQTAGGGATSWEEAGPTLLGGSGGAKWEAANWLPHNPLGVPTEREVYVQSERLGTQVFRLLLVRCTQRPAGQMLEE